MDLNELASDLFGSKRAESSTQPSTVSVMYGIATSDSADGLVSVWLSDNALSPTDAQAQWETVDSYDADAYEGMDESTSIEIPTEVTCFKDDVVRVQLTGAGAAKNPTVVGVVGRGDEQNQRLGSIEADYVKATELEADVAQIGFLKADSAVITNLQADTAKVHNLTADQLTAATAYIADLNTANITAQTLSADVAKVHNLTADQLSAAAAYIAALKADSIEAENITAMYGDFDTVKANAAKVSSLTAQQLTAAVGYINDLTSASVTAQNLAADHATIGNLDANYARVDLVNANVAWLQNGLIKDASISDAKIIGVSANKLTAGTIDAAEINVMNLRADNLKVSRVNGQPVLGGYSLVDPSGSGYASKNPKTQGWYELTANGYVLTDDTTVVSGKAYYTTSTSVELYDQDYIDGLAEDLSDRIDGAIETFTSSAVPTPSNYPASDWTTDDIRATHVGDVCYVLNEASDSDGWCYRYAYDNTTHQYGWVLIKDSDVTKALYELTDPNGELKTFETQTSTWKTATDNEITSIKSSQTSLEGRMTTAEGQIALKVDSSTFNTVSQTVNENVARINTLTTTTSTLANPNLSPFYSNEFYDGDYWSSANSPYSSELGKCFTQLEDGWAHVDFDNSERTSNAYHNVYVKQPIDHIKPDTTYTFVYEVRNLSIVGDGALVLYGQDSQASDQMASHSASITITEDGVYRMTFTSRSSFTDAMVRPVRVCLRIGASTNAQLDVRASLYEGEYTGPYKPYINAYTVTTISNTVNEVKQTATSNSTTISQLTQTLGTNADGTTKTDDIVHRTAKVEQDLDGITTTVGRIDSEMETVSNPNLSPYFSTPIDDVYDATDNPNGYWKRITTNAQFTTYDMQVEHNGSGGWAHFAGTATSSNPYVRFEPLPIATLKPSTKYTFVVEADVITANVTNIKIQLTGGQSQTDTKDQFAAALEQYTKESGVFYIEATTVSDFSSANGLSRSYFQIYGTGAFDAYVRISLFEGEYKGQYKPYVDQTLSTRVKAAETSITQNAEAIELRATKTEAYQVAQPNLTPYFLMPMTQSNDTYWDNITYTRFTQLEDGWAHFSYANSGSSTVNNYILPKIITTLTPGGRYTLLVEFRNVSISADGGNFYSQQNAYAQVWGTDSYGGFSISNAAIRALTNSAGVFHESLTLLTADSKDPSGTVRGSLPKTQFMSINQQVAAGQSISYDLRLSLYEGEYTGPYKPYVGDKLYASQAELKVANNEISARVEKSGVIAAINASVEEEGGSAVKIIADKVNIEGATIFTSGRLSSTSLNNAYDAKGAASTVQTNLDNLQVGGRNLVLGTADWSKWLSSSGATISGDEITYSANDTNNRLEGIAVTPGDTYTISMDIRADSAYTYGTTGNTFLLLDYGTSGEYSRVSTAWIFYGTALTTDWQRVSETFTVPSTDTIAQLYVSFRNVDSNPPTYHVRHLKVERGNKATDWTPAPEDQVESAYATCSTAAGTAAKVVDASGMFDLHNGVMITVKFTTANTADAPTLNVNDTGAYPVWNNNAVAASGNPVKWGANATLSFIFDGSHWVLAEKAPSYSIACSTAATTRAKAATINGALVVNGTTVAVLFSTANTYVANSVQFNLSSTGAVNIYLDRAVTSATHTFTWSANTVITLVRNGAGWYVSDGRAKDSVSVSQRIYYRSAASTKPDAPTAWVEEATENVYNAWTTKVPPLAASTAEGQTKYLYLWTCEQRKAMSGSFVGCTDVQLDENTTVIDGGNIITHSIAAESIQANSLTLGQISTTTQTDILNSKVQVGGRNLLRKTASLSASDLNLARATVTEDGLIALTPTTSAAYASFKVHYLDFDEYGSGTYTVSFDAKLSDATTTYTTSNVLAYLGFHDPERVDSAVLSSTYDRYTPSRTLSSELTSEWQRFETVVDVPDDLTSGKAAALSSGYMMVVELGASGSKKPILIRHVKLERGTKATDWTTAPEDQTEYVDGSVKNIQNNLTEEVGKVDDRVGEVERTATKAGEDALSAQQTADRAESLAGALNVKTSWLHFDAESGTGLHIGKTGSQFQTVVDEDSMDFMYDDQLLAKASGTEGFKADLMTTNTLSLGDYSLYVSAGMFVIDYIGS